MPHGVEETRTTPWPRRATLAAVLALASACGGPQSTLDPAGVAAERIAHLFWWMCGAAALIWLAVMGIAIYAMHIRRESHSRRAGQWLIILGGAAFPVVALSVLLVFSLPMLPDLKASAGSDLRIEVSGEQWWWRVRYVTADGREAALANEVRLPVGEAVDFILTSPDVIHSFWIPSLGGKMDMIPGRVTRLTLEATRTGTFHGICAEYCGSAHAQMKFLVQVMPPEEFRDWLARQAAPAADPDSSLAREGSGAFLANGCGACHTIRGTPADGRLGPDLTHVGSRMSLAAGVLPNDPESFLAWIRHPEDSKPDARMPAFDMLPARQLEAIAAYLEGLE